MAAFKSAVEPSEFPIRYATTYSTDTGKPSFDGEAVGAAVEDGATGLPVGEVLTGTDVGMSVGSKLIGTAVTGTEVVGGEVTGCIVIGCEVMGCVVVGGKVMGCAVAGGKVMGCAVVGGKVMGFAVVGDSVTGLLVVGAGVVGDKLVGDFEGIEVGNVGEDVGSVVGVDVPIVRSIAFVVVRHTDNRYSSWSGLGVSPSFVPSLLIWALSPMQHIWSV